MNNINLEIPENKTTAIVGTSGSGKTTLLNAIGALDSISSGKIYFEDREITSLNEKERSLKVGQITLTSVNLSRIIMSHTIFLKSSTIVCYYRLDYWILERKIQFTCPPLDAMK